MSNPLRRDFRPTLDGLRLEDRVVLSTTSAASAVAGNPPSLVVTSQSAGVTLHQITKAFNAFQTKYTRAVQKAISGLANGQTNASLVSSLQAYVTLEGNVLQNQLSTASKRIPFGYTFLYQPPSGAITGQQSYVPASQRIETQVNALISAMTSSSITTVQQASSQSVIQIISQTYNNVRAAGKLYIQSSINNNNFTVIGWQSPA